VYHPRNEHIALWFCSSAARNR